jgi:hypothetical protein
MKRRCPLLEVPNLSGGELGQVPYQESYSKTVFTNVGSNNQILTIDSSVPTFKAPAIPPNVLGGVAGQVLYQQAPSTTTFTNTGSINQILTVDTGGPTFKNPAIPPNILGGSAGKVLYQLGPSTTGFTNTGSNGQILKIVTGIPTFVTPVLTPPTITQIIASNTDIESTYTAPDGCLYIKVTLVAGGGGCSALGIAAATNLAGGGGGAGFKGIFPAYIYDYKVGRYGDGGQTVPPYNVAGNGGNSYWKAGLDYISLDGGGGASSAVAVVPAVGGTGGTATNGTGFRVLLANGGTGMDGEEYAIGQLPSISFGGGSIICPSGGAQNLQGDAPPGSGRGGTMFSGISGRSGNGGSGQLYIEEYYN